MKKNVLFCIWLVLYAICAGLGFLENPQGLQKAALMAISLIFFIPGVILLVDSILKKDKKTLCILRWVSGLSLGLTTLAIIANVFSVFGSAALGSTLYAILILVSVPMVSGQLWFVSLFLWACLFFTTIWARKRV